MLPTKPGAQPSSPTTVWFLSPLADIRDRVAQRAGSAVAGAKKPSFTEGAFNTILHGGELDGGQIADFMTFVQREGILSDDFGTTFMQNAMNISAKSLKIRGVVPVSQSDSLRGLLAYLVGLTYKGFRLDFSGVIFQPWVDLCEANLKGANFSYTDVSGVKFRRAVLIDADFSGATFHDTILDGAQMLRTNLEGADLSKAIIWRHDTRHVRIPGEAGAGHGFSTETPRITAEWLSDKWAMFDDFTVMWEWREDQVKWVLIGDRIGH